MLNALRGYRYLFVIWFLELRRTLPGTLLGALVPSTLLAVALRLGDHLAGPERRALIVGGGGILAVMLITLLALPGFVARLREQGQIAHFATFPITRTPLLGALLTIYVLLALPVGILAIVINAWIVALPLAVSPLAILVAPLIVACFAAIGLLVGVMAPSEHAASILGGILATLLIAAPLFLLIPGVHPVLHWTGIFLPTGVAWDASAGLVRNALASLPLDMLLLIAYALLAFFGAERALPWHPGDQRVNFVPRV